MDLSEVAEGLYIASNFYSWDDSVSGMIGFDCRVLRDDDSDQARDIERIAQIVKHTWDLSPVVLSCDAGRNRSAVVAARVLMLKDRHLGAKEAIWTVRDARWGPLGRSGGALTNDAFVDHLFSVQMAS